MAAYFSHPPRFEFQQLPQAEEGHEPIAVTAPFDAVFAASDAERDWLRQARASFDAWLAHVVDGLFAGEDSESAGPVISLRALFVADDAGPRIAAWGFQITAQGGGANDESKSGEEEATDGEDGGFTLLMMNFPPYANPDGTYLAYTNTQLTVAAPGVLANDTDMDGPAALTAVLYSQAVHGVVSLNSNGSFAYMPATDYFGPDNFQYRAFDGMAYSAVVAAAINVVRPTIDVDTDSNNNGTIEGATEDAIEMEDPGNIIWYNWDDDNGSGIDDRLDPAPFVDGAGQPVSDNELEPATLSLTDVPNGFTVEIVKHGGEINLWKTTDKQALPLTYTIGTDTLPAQFYVEGFDYGQATVETILRNQAGTVVHRDEIKVTVASVNLIGYRPTTEGPDYGDPFPKIAVPTEKESTPGIGIRKNGDDDDKDNPGPDLSPADLGIANENDLIEIDLVIEAGNAGGLQWVLRRSNADLNVFTGQSKTGPLLDSDNPNVMVSPPLTVDEAWVEWDGIVPGETHLRLELQDARYGNMALFDRVTFRPFTSVVIAFGGNTNSPLDAVDGAFNIAEDLYEIGYDVHAYDEDIINLEESIPYREVKSAIEERGVSAVAIFGYSYGGGATYLLHNQLRANAPAGAWELVFTAYIDAVRHEGVLSETRPLLSSLYHVNYYRPGVFPAGAPVDDAAANVDVHETTWGAGLSHTQIDSDLFVQERIKNGYHGEVDPQHDGLTEKTSR